MGFNGDEGRGEEDLEGEVVVAVCKVVMVEEWFVVVDE